MRIVVFPIDAFAFTARFLEPDLRVLVRMRKNIGKKGEQARGAHIARRGDHEHRNDLLRHDGLANRRYQVLDRNRAFAEELFHHLVVAFRDHFHELFVCFFRLILQRIRNVLDARLSVAVRRIDMRFHGNQIDHAAETFFRPDRQLQRHDCSAEQLDERFHAALEARKFAIHPGQHEGARNIVLGAIVPDPFGRHLGADMGVHGD